MKLSGFIGASYIQNAQAVDVEDCVNLYPEIQESPGAKAAMVLYGSPGLSLYHDFVNNGPIRGSIQIESYTYTVSDGILYQEDPNGVWAICDTGPVADGNIGSDTAQVVFAASTTQILVLSAGNVYVVVDRSITPVPSPPWVLAQDLAFLDGYWIVLENDNSEITQGGNFFITTNPLVWDPLDFSNAPASNNRLLALGVDHDELWIFGSVITQPFNNNGNGDFPFVPNPTGVIMQGIEARDTRQLLDNTLYWMGRNKDGQLQAFRANGYTPERISTHSQEQQWQRYPYPLDATSWTYQIDGHSVYHVSFQSFGASWRYDRSCELWHRVSYRNPTTNRNEAHLGANHIVRNGTHLVGDRQSSKLWVFSPTVYADGDDPMVSMRRTPAGFSENRIIFYPIFELITPGGIGDGTTNTPQSNPAWMLRWSNDNGNNWSMEYQLAAGRQGEYGTRLRKAGCGSGRNRVWEVSISAAVPRCLIGAEIPGAYVGTS